MKIYLDTIGCRLNQSEIETMARQFRAAGHEIVATADLADMAVVNTCSVTSNAASDSRGKIRQIARAGVDEIVATGCWSTLQPQKAQNLPNVLHVIANDRKDHLVADVLDLPQETFDIEPISRKPLPGLHRRTRAVVKVQDGCDNQCTFCMDGGTKEVVLTGVHLGSWGYDFDSNLSDLIKAILRETDIPRLRLSSLEPWDLSTDFFSLWDDKRLMPHLHLPLQSGSSSTLKRMLRHTTPESFRELMSAARQAIPDVSITTDIIAGFPGETEEEFAETLDFVREMEFSGGHVFTYSPRPGTGAARMKGQIKPQLRKKRNHILQDVIGESAKSYREKFIGRKMSTLWESTSEMGEQGWLMEGLTENYLRVNAFAPSPRWNEIDDVLLINSSDERMQGEIIRSR